MNKSAFPAMEKLLLSTLMKEDVQAIHKIIKNNSTISSLEDQSLQSMEDKIRQILEEKQK